MFKLNNFLSGGANSDGRQRDCRRPPAFGNVERVRRLQASDRLVAAQPQGLRRPQRKRDGDVENREPADRPLRQGARNGARRGSGDGGRLDKRGRHSLHDERGAPPAGLSTCGQDDRVR